MRNASILTMVFVAIAFIPASATIINVPANQPNIQAGINASFDGDTVLVQPDTYYENITSSNVAPVVAPLKAPKHAPIHADKALRGTGGQPSTTLDQFCPTGSLFDQPPTPVTGGWTHATSEQNPGYLCQEDFNSVSGIICDIHFWGLNLEYDAGWGACDPPENPMPFEIIFYDDIDGAPGNIVGIYNPTLVGTPTGELYADIYEMYAYDYVLDPCVNLINGWVSIQGQGDITCWFLWTSHGETGDGYSLQNGAATNYDLSLCLTGEIIDRYGACCDDETGDCTDDVLMEQCPPPLRWAENTACVDLEPACGATLGACCDDSDGTCTDDVQQSACLPPLRWAEGILCADLDPVCGGCPEDAMTINIFTDDYPEETTWEVVDQATGLPIASGGPLVQAQTLHTWVVCVDSDGCYDFIIYDAYGDGICCAYGQGWYEVYLNATLVGSNYAEWANGSMETVPDIGGCGMGYEYLPGDANMYNGIWPPEFIGSDVTYLVNHFRGYETNLPCYLDGFWCSADVNGDCNVIGSDITRMVSYFRGQIGILYCPDYEPLWQTPDDLPDEAPDGWPNCETPVINRKIIPTGSVK